MSDLHGDISVGLNEIMESVTRWWSHLDCNGFKTGVWFCDNFVELIIHKNIKAVLKQHIFGNFDGTV